MSTFGIKVMWASYAQLLMQRHCCSIHCWTSHWWSRIENHQTWRVWRVIANFTFNLSCLYFSSSNFVADPLCGGILSANESEAIVTSPSYPLAYPANSRCVWVIVGVFERNKLLEINVTDMDMGAELKKFQRWNFGISWKSTGQMKLYTLTTLALTTLPYYVCLITMLTCLLLCLYSYFA